MHFSTLLATTTLACLAGLSMGRYISQADLHCPSGIHGSFNFNDNHKGYAAVTVSFAGLTEGEQYNYFINENKVPENGDCSKTGMMYDPDDIYANPTAYKCTNDGSNKCAIGDLTGRGGVLVGAAKGQNSTLEWRDKRVRLRGSHDITGHSIVLFDQQERMILCGNIYKIS
ncbi:hypothetical protein H4R34_000619 [Dimargaris verticillata]|uniref:Superoxide dismutase copper/zinc binding domain-containing protein n=1 Tax=Dimargaris verticillata TaxID=2761393 RepID=A0A9W8EBP2_9FUNG|nr:hypothetical protein H4R34_000619 [Dimargaris verticillata]